METIYFAGGCFWGVQKFFDQFDGVVSTEVGYANGNTEETSYDRVDGTGHAETVRIEFDTTRITLQELLDYYFMIIDPFSVNKQGPDVGIQYRTGIYYTDERQLPVIRAAVRKVEKKSGAGRVAVEVEKIRNYCTAEPGHQEYLDRVPGGYCHVRANMFRMQELRKPIDMRVFLMRHGRTAMNAERMIQGRKNTLLNDTGIDQANIVARKIKERGLTFDRIYSSPLERALRTCEIATGRERDDFVIEPRIAEMDFGALEGRKYEELPDDQKYFFTAPERYIPQGGGETIDGMIERVGGFFDDLKERKPAKTILAASHGAAIHGMLSYLRGKSIEDFWDEDVGNCDVIEVDLIGNEFVVRDDKISLESGNIEYVRQ